MHVTTDIVYIDTRSSKHKLYEIKISFSPPHFFVYNLLLPPSPPQRRLVFVCKYHHHHRCRYYHLLHNHLHNHRLHRHHRHHHGNHGNHHQNTHHTNYPCFRLDESKKYRQQDRETINKLNQAVADLESELNMLRRTIESLETERGRDKAAISRLQQEVDKLRIVSTRSLVLSYVVCMHT